MEEFSWKSVVAEISGFCARLRARLPDDLMSRDTATELVLLTRPVEPFNYSDLAAPVIGLAGVLLGLLLAGVAVASLGTLAASLLALGFLLTEVFGVTLEMAEFSPPR